MAEPLFVLREFGVPALERRDGTIVHRGGKHLAVLLWLAHAHPRRSSREELIGLFWPHDPPANGRRSLRQALSVHRRWLGEAAIHTDGELVWLSPQSLALESAYWRDAARRNAWTTADAVWRGVWALHAESVGGPDFGHWIVGMRERLEREFTTAAVGRVALHLAAGEVHEAFRAAQQACERLPHSELLARQCADAAVAVGAFDEAGAVLDRFRQTTGQHAGPLPAPLAAIERRLHGRAGTGSDRGRVAPIGDRLVGRDLVVGTLFRALADAQHNGARRVVVTGGAGMGKTRLLDELEARWRTRAVHMVRIRLEPEMRDVSGAAITAYLREVATLPGAAGVGQDTTAVLLSLAPELRSLFAGSDVAAVAASEATVAAAVNDLLRAVADERLTVLLLDDLQHADAFSRAVWRRLDPGSDAPLLEVATTREDTAGDDGTPIPLSRLAIADIQHLLEDAALLPRDAAVPELLDMLDRISGGRPGVLLRALRVLEGRGALYRRGGEWVLNREALERTAIMRTLADARAPGTGQAAQLHEVLRLWGRPLEQSHLLSIAGAVWPAVDADAWRAALRGLEAEGLATVRAGEWNATEADGVPLPMDTVERMLLAMATHAVRTPEPLLGTLEHICRLAGAYDRLGVAKQLIRRSARHPAMRSTGLVGRSLARRFAAAAGRPEWEAPLLDAIGVLARRSQRELVAIGAAVSIGCAAMLLLAALVQPRVVVEASPMAMAGTGGPVGLVVQPRVGFYDGFGRHLDLDVPVRVTGERAGVIGDTVRWSVGGRAQFERLALSPPVAPPLHGDGRPPVLVFRGPWFARTARVAVAGASWDDARDRFRVVRATVNGHPHDPQRVVRLRSGDDSVRVTLTFEFTTDNATANYVVGAGPTWLPHERSVVRIAGLPRPVVNAWQTVRFALPAPRQPGRHALIVAMGTEDSADHLFSATNWALGAPRWNDGNDLQDMPERLRQVLRDSGRVVHAGALTGRYRRPEGALAIGDSAWRVGVGEYATTGALEIHGTAFEIEVAG